MPWIFKLGIIEPEYNIKFKLLGKHERNNPEVKGKIIKSNSEWLFIQETKNYYWFLSNVKNIVYPFSYKDLEISLGALTQIWESFNKDTILYNVLTGFTFEEFQIL